MMGREALQAWEVIVLNKLICSKSSEISNKTDEKEDRLIHFPYPNDHDNFDIGVFCVWLYFSHLHFGQICDMRL